MSENNYTIDQMLDCLDYGESKLEDAIDILNVLIEESDLNDATRALAIFHFTFMAYGYKLDQIEYGFDVDQEVEDYFHLLVDAITNYRLGDFKEAVKQFKDALTMFPDSRIPHYFLAAIYSDSSYRNDEKMIHHIEQLDHEEYTDIMVLGNENSMGLPDIYVAPQGSNHHENAIKLKGTEKDLEEYIALITEKNKKISHLNEELERVTENNRKMVERYSHNWTNLLIPEKVLNVVNTLKNHPELKKEARTLLDAYNQEVLLQQQSRMLEIRHSGNPKEMKQYLRKGRLTSRKAEKDPDNAIQVDEIFNHALQRILFRLLFNEHDARAQYVQGKLEKEGFQLSKLRESYNDLFFTDNPDWSKWLAASIVPFELDKDESWDHIYLVRKSGTVAFIDEIISELLLNMFTYGILSKHTTFKMELGMEELDGLLFYTIQSTNDVDPDNGFTAGTKSGLSSLKTLLNMINFDDDEELLEKNLTQSRNQEAFQVKLVIKQELLYKKNR